MKGTAIIIENNDSAVNSSKEPDYNVQQPESNKNPLNLFFSYFIILIKGIITGIAGIIPGFSGGVMMLVFGVYEPLMFVFSHPFSGIKKYWKLLFPFGFGIGIGFILSARVLADLFTAFEIEATYLFFGLVIGMIPSLFREAGKKGRNQGSFIALAVSLIIALTFFSIIKLNTGITIAPNFGWYIFCGILWGLSLIVPGMSSSSTLMLLGLYIPWSEGIGNFDMAVIIPWGIGLFATIIALSRLVNFIFEKYYSIASHCIIGIVLAATLPLLIQDFSGTSQTVICILLAVIGFAAALAADKLETAVKNKNNNVV